VPFNVLKTTADNQASQTCSNEGSARELSLTRDDNDKVYRCSRCWGAETGYSGTVGICTGQCEGISQCMTLHLSVCLDDEQWTRYSPARIFVGVDKLESFEYTLPSRLQRLKYDRSTVRRGPPSSDKVKAMGDMISNRNCKVVVSDNLELISLGIHSPRPSCR
jgi:hypothetical protein